MASFLRRSRSRLRHLRFRSLFRSLRRVVLRIRPTSISRRQRRCRLLLLYGTGEGLLGSLCWCWRGALARGSDRPLLGGTGIVHTIKKRVFSRYGPSPNIKDQHFKFERLAAGFGFSLPFVCMPVCPNRPGPHSFFSLHAAASNIHPRRFTNHHITISYPAPRINTLQGLIMHLGMHRWGMVDP